VRRDDLSQSIIFLQIDRQVRRRLPPNLCQGGSVFLAVDSDPDYVRPSIGHQVDQSDRGVNVRCFRRRHGLDRDWVAIANCHATDLYRSRLVSLNVYHGELRASCSLNADIDEKLRSLGLRFQF
jgi:hypothetical protein